MSMEWWLFGAYVIVGAFLGWILLYDYEPESFMGAAFDPNESGALFTARFMYSIIWLPLLLVGGATIGLWVGTHELARRTRDAWRHQWPSQR